MKYLQHLLFISIILLFWFELSAQNPHPYFRHYTTDNGLPSPEVHYCIQDSNGYMWFATDNGVSRFNGYEFKNYGPKEGLKHNVVFYMQEDMEKRIWMATMHGQLYYIEKDSIHAFDKNYLIEQYNSKSQIIRDFYIDSLSNKYLSIASPGILKFMNDGSFKQLKPSKTDFLKQAIYINDRWLISVQEIPQAIKQMYWNEEVKELNEPPLEIYRDSTFLLEPIIINEKYRHTGDWLKTFRKQGTLRFLKGSFYKIEGSHYAWVKNFDHRIELKAVLQDKNDRILIGALNGGGIRRYKDLEAIRVGKFEQFLKGNSVSCIYKDKDEGYWICTIDNGVFYCPDFDLKIFDRSAGFPSDHVAAIDFDTQGNLIAGFINGDIISINRSDYHIKTFPKPENHNIIIDILYDKDREELWMTNRQLNVFTNGQWKTIIHQSGINRYINFISKKISFDNKQTYLWGGHHGGFGQLDLTKKESVYFSGDHGIDSRTLKVWEDKANHIWIANVHGLFEFKEGTLHPPTPFHPEFKTRAEDMAELSDGSMVIATKGDGILIWKENFFKKITIQDGLTSNMIENVHVDKKDQIWAGTLEGLNKIVRFGDCWESKNWDVRSYTVFNGLPSNEITQIKSKDSTLFVATTKGLLQWQETDQKQNSVPPIIEHIRVNNKNMDLTKKLELSHRENNLEFGLLSINYKMNGKIPYRFKIDGSDWNYTSNRSIYFANLYPKNYLLELQSQNENGLWSPSHIKAFSILPAFWQTMWFYIFLTLASFGIIWLFFRNRIRRIREAARIEKEMNELQRASLRAQMNPHFIFNCLNSIQNFINQKDQKNATIYLSRFAKLVRGTLNASMENSISLEDEIKLLENYLELEKLRFKEKFEYKIHVDPKLDLYDTELPPLLSQPLVENAIIHGMKNKISDGFISIIYTSQDNQLVIEILDNGEGIYQTQKKSKMASQLYKSVGMNISKKRLELANQANKMEIREIKNDQDRIIGTSIKLFVDQ